MPGQLQSCWPFPWSYLGSFPPRGDLRCSQCLLRALGLLGLGGGSSLGSAEVLGGRNACKGITKNAEQGGANPWLLGSSPLKCRLAEGSPAQSALQPTPLSLVSLSVDVGKSPHVPYVYVSHHGEVQNLKPIQVMTACSLDIYNFPFDVQNCSLTFTSWLHHIRDINLSLWRQPELVKFDQSVFMNQGEWELLYVLSHFQEFSVKSSDSYAEMKFYVVIRRRPLFYTVSLLLPSIFLMVMDIVGFYLPPHSGERVSFKITLLLGYSVFLIIVSDTLPATAVGTPLIGIYFVVCMALLVISLTETILIVRLVHQQDLQPQVPTWVKHLLLERATILLCVRDRKKFSQSRTQSLDTSRQAENNDSTAKPTPYVCEEPRECGAGGGTRAALAFAGRPEGSAALQEVLRETTAIRQLLEKREEFRDVAREWLQVGYVLDVLLFRVYLAAVLAYSITLGTLWSVWRDA
ncbi:5-hydroxytryptamine receptor 3A isoform X2 [Motacilla alba alba]|uniref:5-hydroxytryptamine receptor 3A isoform X2 n=1 Tax=Motacilla alba alba TaxID=1094192 RepID=UPI0018D4DE44|nr:5-hydroxytryptamine receptor 3A isoform X2 [Motacilla alba alba]